MRFTITGEFVTERLRSMWEESPSQALRYSKGSLPDMTLDDTIHIIEGRKKLIGNNELDLVDDGQYTLPEGVPTYLEFISAAEYAIKCFDTAKSSSSLFSRAQCIVMEATSLQRSIAGSGYTNSIYQDVLHLRDSWLRIPPYIRNTVQNVPVVLSKELRKSDHYQDDYYRKVYNMDSELYNMARAICRTDTPHNLMAEQLALKITSYRDYEVACYCNHIYQPAVKEAWDRVDGYRQKLIADERKTRDERQLEAMRKSLATRKKKSLNSSFKQEYGWITEKGVFYGCDYLGHADLAEQILWEKYDVEECENWEGEAEARNWVRVHYEDGEGLMISVLHIEKVTQAQLDTLFDFCSAKDLSTEYEMFRDKYEKNGGSNAH